MNKPLSSTQHYIHDHDRLARYATAYAKQEDNGSEGNVFEIPEDLGALTDQELADLNEQAITNFDSVYGDGNGLSEDDMEVLNGLTEGIEALAVELNTRREAEEARQAAASELASRVHGETQDSEQDQDSTEDSEDDPDTPQDDADDPQKDEQDEDGEPSGEDDGDAPQARTDDQDADSDQPEAVAASGGRKRGAVRVSMSRARRRSVPARQEAAPTRIQDIMSSTSDVGGYATGAGLDWGSLSALVQHRLRGFNQGQYAAARKAGRHLHQQHSLAVIQKNYPEDLTITSNDAAHIEEVLKRATDEKRLPKGSLTASGGWCAPSEVTYDLLELESNDGLLSLPEVNLARGGLQFTRGPEFADFYGQGFHYTEAEDQDGDYDGQGGGSKPCFRVPCPEFEEARLDLIGLCLSAGLLQQRGFPEMTARTSRGALVAHRHYISSYLIDAMVSGSDAVTMDTKQGAATPVLDAIELQVEHARYRQRLARATTLEAVFPFWVHGALRADMAKRGGSTDFLSVTDAQINAWFAVRGVNTQFVYDWQEITGNATDFTSWPTTLQFLLYPAGTWVRGNNDVITLDMMYDSQNLGVNDFTALFTEEGIVAMKRGNDSRVVESSICPDGVTAAAVAFDCDGTTTTEA